MLKNLGKADRIIRVILACILIFAGLSSKGLGFVFAFSLIGAAILIITALFSMCPIYRLVGLKTCQDCSQ